MENDSSETIFAKIIRREIPAEVIYEDDRTIAILDIHPATPGHTVVIAKSWSRNLLDMEPETAQAMMETVHKIARVVMEGVGATGTTILMNNEPASAQMVFHAHIQIIPRFENDGLKDFPQGSYAPGEMQEVAAKIRPLLEANS